MTPIVLASNRGPLSWSLDDAGRPTAKRGAGGLVSGLAPLVAGTDTLWIASALGPGDRRASQLGLDEGDGIRCRLICHDDLSLRLAYDVVGNATLWFLHHGLYDLARRPRFDRRFAEAWEGFREFNRTFASAIVESAPEGAIVLLQDYHLSLTGALVARSRPDLRLVHFSHTPFAGPDWLGVLPDPYRGELLDGLAANRACAFHTRRWREGFVHSMTTFGREAPATAVTPSGPDPADLDAVATSAACADAGRQLDELIGDRRLLLRVDRIELSKNLLRGFWAFDELLQDRPEWRERVVFAALVYPSREGLPEYLAYRQEIDHVVARINDRWSKPGWTPIIVETADDFPRSVAALQRYDVLLVNPIRDGMNLVAKEGPLLNRRHGAVVLSYEAGAWDELADAVLGVHPYDIGGTAEAIRRGLELSEAERRQRHQTLRRAVLARGPRHWLDDQLALAG